MTAHFELRFKSSVITVLTSILRTDAARIPQTLGNLQDNPRPTNAQPLTGRDAWRIRIGRFRTIYTIDDYNVTLEVVKVGP